MPQKANIFEPYYNYIIMALIVVGMAISGVVQIPFLSLSDAQTQTGEEFLSRLEFKSYIEGHRKETREDSKALRVEMENVNKTLNNINLGLARLEALNKVK